MKNNKVKVNWSKFIKTTCCLILTIFAIMSATHVIANALDPEIKDKATIAHCESKDDSVYAEEKDGLADFIKAKTGKYPEKVVFYTNGERPIYKVTIYYRIDNTWYIESVWDTEIHEFSPSLEQSIYEIFIGLR